MKSNLAARTVLLAVATTLSVGLYAADKMAPDKKPANPDQAFVMEAAQDGHAEVEHGKLAQKNASSSAVKEYGQRMVTDHSKAGAELSAIAKKLGIAPPADMGDKHKAEHKKLAALKGDKFDSEYAAHMVQAHQTAVNLFQKQAKQGDAKELRDFAAKSLPLLEEHLKMARALKDGKK
jgi:putative membrane protein